MKATSKFFKTTIATIFGWLLLTTANPALAGPATLTNSGDEWRVTTMGLISAWAGPVSWDIGGNEEDSFRITTGYNPSKFELVVAAPEHNGLNISSYFQVASSLQSAGSSRRTGEQVEVRGASIDVAGDFGTIQIGRNFGVFATYPVIFDTSSMRGVGYICVGPDGGGPNCGHIGTGYTWPDWTSGIRYFSPGGPGFQIRLGLTDAVESAFVGAPIPGTGAIETSTPMIEAELIYTGGNLILWAGLLNQAVDDLGTGGGSTDITGTNIGGRLTLGNLGISANFESNEGIAEGFIGSGVACGAGGCEAVEGDQFYVNIDYTAGDTVFGVSYGEGSEDANAALGTDNVDRELVMFFIQHQLTPAFNVNLEIQSFERVTDGTGVAAGVFAPQEEYSAVLVGGEYRF